MGQSIPHAEAQTLSGKKIVLPDAVAGHPAIFIIGFSRAGGDSSGRWGKELKKELGQNSSLQIYSVAELQDAPGFARGMIKHAMRNGTPKPEQDYFIVLDKDEDTWKKFADFSDANDAYVVLVDGSGKVRWRTHSKSPNAQSIDALKAALGAIA